ncbi:unnamed protein product [Arabidopsis thaliana]|uniref:Uncharacterized protein n=1 Tax=Arabidopsis thaliana TaxID=3702 RepID=A0A654EYY6_ARATH|nr:unnamed protein product [Arabidopsis thaliana]
MRATNHVSILLGQRRCIESIGVSLWVQEVEITEDFLLLDLTETEADVILGYSWLSKLGETWQDHTFAFSHNQDWISFSNKEEELKQNTNKMKMWSEYVKKGIEDEQISDCGMVVDDYLEDKFGFSGEGNGRFVSWKVAEMDKAKFEFAKRVCSFMISFVIAGAGVTTGLQMLKENQIEVEGRTRKLKKLKQGTRGCVRSRSTNNGSNCRRSFLRNDVSHYISKVTC